MCVRVCGGGSENIVTGCIYVCGGGGGACSARGWKLWGKQQGADAGVNGGGGGSVGKQERQGFSVRGRVLVHVAGFAL